MDITLETLMQLGPLYVAVPILMMIILRKEGVKK